MKHISSGGVSLETAICAYVTYSLQEALHLLRLHTLHSRGASMSWNTEIPSLLRIICPLSNIHQCLNYHKNEPYLYVLMHCDLDSFRNRPHTTRRCVSLSHFKLPIYIAHHRSYHDCLPPPLSQLPSPIHLWGGAGKAERHSKGGTPQLEHTAWLFLFIFKTHSYIETITSLSNLSIKI